MATADAFRGLAEFDYSVYAPDNPADRFRAAFPTFRTFAPAGGGVRDEVVVLRASVAGSHARSFTMFGGVVDETNIPAVFRTINPAGDPTTCGFPTFTYGQNSTGRFINVIELKSGFRRRTAPAGTPGLTDLTMVETACAAAQTFAVANGFAAGFPTFRAIAGGAELVVFDLPAPGVLVNSAALGGGAGPAQWTFRTLPVISDGAHALATDGVDPIIFHSVDDVVGGVPDADLRNLFEFKASTPPMITPIDPDAAGNRQNNTFLGQCSAAVAGGMVHLLYFNRALMHAMHPLGFPAALTFQAASGSTIAQGYSGYYNCVCVAPDGTLHALAFVESPIGMVPIPGILEASQRNLVHLTFNGAAWSQEPVDGHANTASGAMVADMGQTMCLVFEPNGTAHAFYEQTIPALATGAGPATHRLRHAERRPAGWACETLDGAGSSTPPADPATGPIRANVGLSPTAAFFDGAIWVIYEDLTNGNLRFAHGRRGTNGVMKFDFGLLDGNLRRGSTGGVVQAAAAVVCDDVLSVFYGDRTANVIRRAYRFRTLRNQPAPEWRFELLDGAGGPDGRINGYLAPIVTTVTAGRKADGTPTTPLFVVYRLRPTTGGTTLRLATRM